MQEGISDALDNPQSTHPPVHPFSHEHAHVLDEGGEPGNGHEGEEGNDKKHHAGTGVAERNAGRDFRKLWDERAHYQSCFLVPS